MVNIVAALLGLDQQKPPAKKAKKKKKEKVIEEEPRPTNPQLKKRDQEEAPDGDA